MKVCMSLVLILSITLLCSPIAMNCNAVDDWKNPEIINKIISITKTPSIAPGDTGLLSMNISNHFDESENVEMRNISIIATPYMLVLPNVVLNWSEVKEPPIVVNKSTGSNEVIIERLTSGESREIEWEVRTTTGISNGGWLSDAVYFVRLTLSFTYYNNSNNSQFYVSYASRGAFSNQQWNAIYDPSNHSDTGGIDLVYLKTFGYDGIIPDTSFTIREEIPWWPIILFTFLTMIFFIIGLYIYLLNKPSASPTTLRTLRKIRNMLSLLSSNLNRKTKKGG